MEWAIVQKNSKKGINDLSGYEVIPVILDNVYHHSFEPVWWFIYKNCLFQLLDLFNPIQQKYVFVYESNVFTYGNGGLFCIEPAPFIPEEFDGINSVDIEHDSLKIKAVQKELYTILSGEHSCSSDEFINRKERMSLNKTSLIYWDEKVKDDPQYGAEQSLIAKVLRKYPNNCDTLEIAMKVAVIDVTNSTQLSKHKSALSLWNIAEIIQKMNIDARLAIGDVELVSDIASKFHEHGRNLFSFASKYCCYHNVYVYDRDDYSIYDNFVSKNLSRYATEKNPLNKTQPQKWKNEKEYKLFNDYIGDLLDEYGVDSSVAKRRRMFDYFLWYQYRKQ